MPELETVRITLPPEIAGEIEAAVASGEYASASDVVGEALREWRLRRKLAALELAELRRLVQEGSDSGPAVDGEATFARLRARYGAMARQRGV